MNVSASDNWRLAFKAAVAPFLLSRLWVAIFVYLGHAQRPYLSPVLGGWEGVANWWLNPWTTFDSKHFIDIAAHGYNAHTAPFFPMYAFLLRLAGDNPVAMALWGVLLSNAAFLLALICLYRLTAVEYNARTALFVIWLTAFSPASPYFSAVYSESVFLLMFVATLWCLRRKQWALAALWGFLAAFTRSAGVLIFGGLCLQYALEWFLSKREKPPETIAPETTVTETMATLESRNNGQLWLRALAALGPLLGFLLAQFLIAKQVGNVTQGVAAHQEYFRALTWPWLPIVFDLWDVITLREFQIVMLLNLGATILALILFWKYRKRQPVAYSFMLLGLLLMQLTYSHYSIPRTQSSLRLLATMIPFLQPLGSEISQTRWPKMQQFLGITIGLIITAVSAYVFGQKHFLG